MNQEDPRARLDNLLWPNGAATPLAERRRTLAILRTDPACIAASRVIATVGSYSSPLECARKELLNRPGLCVWSDDIRRAVESADPIGALMALVESRVKAN